MSELVDMVGFLKNRIRRFETGFIFVFISVALMAQEGTYTLFWLPNRVEKAEVDDSTIVRMYPDFKDASFSGNPYVPAFSETFELPGQQDGEYRIQNLIFEPIADSLVAEIDFPDLSPHNYSVNQYHGSGKYYLDIYVEGIRKNPMSQQWERLKQFEIVFLGSAMPGHQKVFAKSSLNEPTRSSLATGSWYRFKVNSTGIYKLTYNDIKGLGFADPAGVSLHGHGGKHLSYQNGDPRPVDMEKIPVYIHRGGDGTFNEGDFMLFYLEGPLKWEFSADSTGLIPQHHPYDDEIFYFLTNSQGGPQEIPQATAVGQPAAIQMNKYDELAYYEENIYNLIGSGRTWYGVTFDEGGYTHSFELENLQSGNQVWVEAKVVARSRLNRPASMLLNGEAADNITIAASDYRASYYQRANEGTFKHSFTASSNKFDLGFTFSQYEVADYAHIDYIAVNARSNLTYRNKPLFFRDLKTVAPGNVVQYQVSNASAAGRIWDVSDIHQLHAIPGALDGSVMRFSVRTDSLREFVYLDPTGSFPKPIVDDSKERVGMIENQDLRGMPLVHYIIITHDDFITQAERLADWHRANSGIKVAVVPVQKVYNEFSSGTRDISAIRDFARQHYHKKTETDSLRYLLLFGDGSYNNHMDIAGNTNYIPTYQSANSLLGTRSYTADDYFGLLDVGEGGDFPGSVDLRGKLDIGVGRFPVKMVNGSDFEAKTVVDKVIRYGEGNFADWRRDLVFLADDGDNNTHMDNSNDVTNDPLKEKYAGFEYKKIFLDAYKQVSSSTGAFYPEAKNDLLNSINRGILFFSYFGHGSENQLADERVLQKADVKSMKNEFLPLFITATCQFSRYDDVDFNFETQKASPRTSAGEEALLNPDGGAIALLTTSRVVYSTENLKLSRALFSCIFDKDADGKPIRLGDVIRQAKNELEDGVNKLNFSLLGDPALRLAFPEFKVITDSINGKAVSQVNGDTLKAFSKVTVTGYVAYDDSTMISDFNGLVYPRVYDKEILITTLANDVGADPYAYYDQQNLIYRGKATVKDGRFTFSFVVPKDISYNLGLGKISYYAENGEIDARGEFNKVFIGGTDTDAEIDYDGPVIDLYMNDENFVDGGITNADPFIYARLFDENGINTTGNGIGHDIVATLNFSSQDSYVLNDYYEADTDRYTSGSVRYQIFDLEAGEHTLGFKAWDVFNNSSEVFINFVVMDGDGLQVEKLINYPNPAVEYTSFQYSHNLPGTHTIRLDVFDVSGRLVTSLTRTLEETGFVSEPLVWNLRDGRGGFLGEGLYPYRITVSTPEGSITLSDKLIIFR